MIVKKSGNLGAQGEATETVFDSERRIVDPHVHLWRRELTGPYLVEDLTGDLDDGHRVRGVIYVECAEQYLTQGPEHLASLGETQFAVTCAGLEDRIAGIVANVDLRRGAEVEDILQRHLEVSNGLLKGVRHAAAYDPHRDQLMNPGKAPPDLLDAGTYREGVKVLGRLGLVNDQLVFFHQIPVLAQIAASAPDTSIVLNHMGLPLCGGAYRARASEVRQAWRKNLAALSEFPNVFLKIGGFASPDAGFGWRHRDAPPSSDEVSAAWRPWFDEAIGYFGPDRCMFESNFPVDRLAMPYRTLWNAFKKAVRGYSSTEQDALFSGTASRVYQL